MGVIERDNFGYLGYEFQLRLIALLLTDPKFASSILDIVNPNYFEDEYLRLIVATIKENNERYDAIPDMAIMESVLMEKATTEVKRANLISLLRKIKEADMNNIIWVQDMATKFCKQQELKKSIKEMQKIIDNGRLEDYEKCEDILRKALEVGNHKDDGIDIGDDIDAALADDFRKPIPTGISGLDELMDGGLSKGELGVILAPFGVGKTTMMTKIANSAKNAGYNVVQIFFEDMPKVIQRKHFSCWTGIELNNLSVRKDEVKEIVSDRLARGGKLKLKKFPSDGTTIPQIKAYLRSLIAKGFRPDIVLVDYIDCVESTKQFKDDWGGEGPVMRQFESMLAELNLAGWTAVQGNRSSIGAELVEANQMGGSIKKGQIGHFIVSIAKTLEQKEEGTATMAILKSRFGRDGIRFDNIVFDNARINIDMTEDGGAQTFLEAEADKERKAREFENNRIRMLMEQNKKRKEELAHQHETSDEVGTNK